MRLHAVKVEPRVPILENFFADNSSHLWGCYHGCWELSLMVGSFPGIL